MRCLHFSTAYDKQWATDLIKNWGRNRKKRGRNSGKDRRYQIAKYLKLRNDSTICMGIRLCICSSHHWRNFWENYQNQTFWAQPQILLKLLFPRWIIYWSLQFFDPQPCIRNRSTSHPIPILLDFHSSITKRVLIWLDFPLRYWYPSRKKSEKSLSHQPLPNQKRHNFRNQHFIRR